MLVAVETEAIPATQKSLPSLTVPQMGVFVTFVLIVLAALLNSVSNAEFPELKKLAVVLVVALLPSDALIRLGRALYVKSAGSKVTSGTAGQSTAETFVPTTLPQVLAFLTFVVVWCLTVFGNSITTAKGKEAVTFAAFTIGALLPSEGAIRFARSIYLRSATNVTAKHLRKI